MRNITEHNQMRKTKLAIKKTVALAKKTRAYTDEQLQHKTEEFKQRIANGETLENLLPEAFAVAREACLRVLGQYPYYVQLLGGATIHNGDIAEMKTGEGKTLTSIMPIYLNALEGKGVHVVTVNEYLAERDATQNGQVLTWLGISVGLNKSDLTKEEKKQVYACDVTYSTNSELGFDYLRDNMVVKEEEKVMRGLNFALIDEIDSVLIDEARTPLIIAGNGKDHGEKFQYAYAIVDALPEAFVDVSVRDRHASLNEAGIAEVERIFHIENLFDPTNNELTHLINQCLSARFVMKKDIDYMVKDGEILIIDPNTGRLMEGREWSDGLHQAVCAKEKVEIKKQNKTLATITYQNFFRAYNKLSGMTGTAKTDQEELRETYNMYVFEIPTNRPVARVDLNDMVYGTKRAKYNAIINEVKRIHKTGQPILIGTINVDASEEISSLLTKHGIIHETLNAKNHYKEAQIIASAGKLNAVTIATNMAGRGTDIKLDAKAKELGGLYVIGTERHESRRIDNQLRGRSGRQGDPGTSQFFVSLEDDLMKRFGSESLEEQFKEIGDDVVTGKLLTSAISQAQKRVEGVNYDARKQILQYDEVVRLQRESIYKQREEILTTINVHESIKHIFNTVSHSIATHYVNFESKNSYYHLKSILSEFGYDLAEDIFNNMNLFDKSFEEVQESIFNVLWNAYDTKVMSATSRDVLTDKNSAMNIFEREMLLYALTNAWTEQVNALDHLRKGVGLRSYAQKDTLLAYKEEGLQLYQQMQDSFYEEVVFKCLTLRIQKRKPVINALQESNT